MNLQALGKRQRQVDAGQGTNQLPAISLSAWQLFCRLSALCLRINRGIVAGVQQEIGVPARGCCTIAPLLLDSRVPPFLNGRARKGQLGSSTSSAILLVANWRMSTVRIHSIRRGFILFGAWMPSSFALSTAPIPSFHIQLLKLDL